MRHPTVAQGEQVVGGIDHRGVVGRDQQGGAALDQAAHRRHEIGAGPAVELGGGLVGQQQAGPPDGRGREGDPLLLAARQLGGEAAGPIGEADGLEQRRCLGGVGALGAGQPARPARRAQVGQQVVGGVLQDHAHRPPSKASPGAGSGPGDVDAVDLDHASPTRCSPANTRSSVDLPEPDGPATTVSRPRRTAASTSCNAWTTPADAV